MTRKFTVFFAGCLLGFGGSLFLPRTRTRPAPEVVTVTRTDTVRQVVEVRSPVPPPMLVEVVRHDTVTVRDTVRVPLPITRETYRTDDYRAVVSGYLPRLEELTLYREKEVIINTTLRTVTRRRRWAMTAGIGMGVVPGGKVKPYVGVGVGYVVWGR